MTVQFGGFAELQAKQDGFLSQWALWSGSSNKDPSTTLKKMTNVSEHGPLVQLPSVSSCREVKFQLILGRSSAGAQSVKSFRTKHDLWHPMAIGPCSLEEGWKKDHRLPNWAPGLPQGTAQGASHRLSTWTDLRFICPDWMPMKKRTVFALQFGSKLEIGSHIVFSHLRSSSLPGDCLAERSSQLVPSGYLEPVFLCPIGCIIMFAFTCVLWCHLFRSQPETLKEKTRTKWFLIQDGITSHLRSKSFLRLSQYAANGETGALSDGHWTGHLRTFMPVVNLLQRWLHC